MPNARRTWPYNGFGSSPPALTITPDTILNSARYCAGPLRLGTAPGVGPRGVPDGPGQRTDYGMDSISPRRMDPMGTSVTRDPPRRPSRLMSRER